SYPTRVAVAPVNDAEPRVIDDVEFGENVVAQQFTNLYGCKIGDNTRVGPFVEIQRGAQIGADCKIQSHAFICTGVMIGDGVFVGHGAVFVNDKYPQATTDDGLLRTEADWKLLETRVEEGASIGSGAVILGGDNRCRGDRRGWSRSHAGRGAAGNRGGQSRASSGQPVQELDIAARLLGPAVGLVPLQSFLRAATRRIGIGSDVDERCG